MCAREACHCKSRNYIGPKDSAQKFPHVRTTRKTYFDVPIVSVINKIDGSYTFYIRARVRSCTRITSYMTRDVRAWEKRRGDANTSGKRLKSFKELSRYFIFVLVAEKKLHAMFRTHVLSTYGGGGVIQLRKLCVPSSVCQYLGSNGKKKNVIAHAMTKSYEYKCVFNYMYVQPRYYNIIDRTRV